MLLTPEESIAIQNNLGADIMMQLDDVVPATNTGKHKMPAAAPGVLLIASLLTLLLSTVMHDLPPCDATHASTVVSFRFYWPAWSIHADQARFEEATYRTTRWLDRCMKANRNPGKQNLFPIVQGGFDMQLRETSMQQVCAGTWAE